MRIPIVVLTTCLILSGCASSGSVAGGDVVSLDGRVTAVEGTRVAVGGDGILIVNSPDHGTVTVRVPTREGTCASQALAVFHTLRVGDGVRVTGAMTGQGVVRICTEPSHRLEKVE